MFPSIMTTKALVAQCYRAWNDYYRLFDKNNSLYRDNERLRDQVNYLSYDNDRLTKENKDLTMLHFSIR